MLFMAIAIFIYGQAEPSGLRHAAFCDIAKEDTLPIIIYPLPSRVNTSFSEYNPILTQDSSLYFTSVRHEGMDDFENLFEFYWYMRVYRSKLTMGGYSKPEPLPAIINSKKYFTANFTINLAQNKMFFTRCSPIVGHERDCAIWGAVCENGKWKKPEPLRQGINLQGTTNTQPFLVEYEDYAVLYFVSDRPKGYGGTDIWYSILKDGRFSDPVNLGSLVNSAKNEMTPFYDQRADVLYFSSDRQGGAGGYDVYHSRGALGDWSLPANMGFPLNSAYDDLYFSVNADGKSGFLSSNRPTVKSLPEDTCCFDIFAYRWLEEKYDEDTVTADTADVETMIQNVLPITLYFHNDEPDPKSWDTITAINYQSALSDYIAMKDDYKREYSKGLSGEKKIEAESRIEYFFNDSVGKGFLKLETITHYLLEELKVGHDVMIKVSGYASALHQKEYNKRLTQRRIFSFVNYLREYENGVFLPYMNGETKNRLLINADPRGSEEAIVKNISDNIHDKRNAIYSISASLERRITITEIEIKK